MGQKKEDWQFWFYISKGKIIFLAWFLNFEVYVVFALVNICHWMLQDLLP